MAGVKPCENVYILTRLNADARQHRSDRHCCVVFKSSYMSSLLSGTDHVAGGNVGSGLGFAGAGGVGGAGGFANIGGGLGGGQVRAMHTN